MGYDLVFLTGFVFSAHPGQSQLLDWVNHFKNTLSGIFLVHGETEAKKVFTGKFSAARLQNGTGTWGMHHRLIFMLLRKF